MEKQRVKYGLGRIPFGFVFLTLALVLVYQNCSKGFKSFTTSDLASQQTVSLGFEILHLKENVNSYVGEASEFRVYALPVVDKNTLDYQWSRLGKSIPGANGPILTLTNSSLSDSGDYDLEIRLKDPKGEIISSQTYTFHLQILNPPAAPMPPKILNNPKSSLLVSGKLSVLRAEVDGFPRPSIQWFKDGQALTGKNSEYFEIPAPVLADEGIYFFNATSSAGTATSNEFLLSYERPSVPPSFRSQISEQLKAVGDKLDLSISAVGLEDPAISWFKDGSLIKQGPRLTVDALNASHRGTYQVVAKNAAGEVSQNFAVRVFEGIRIAQALTDKVVALNAEVVFSVTALGDNLSYEWTVAGAVVPNSNANTLRIANAQANQGGTVTVKITNPLGSVTSSAQLVVVTPPVIADITASVTPRERMPFVLNAVVQGAALTYKWFKNNVEILGSNTPTLNFPSPSIIDSATYTVTVSNIAGTASRSFLVSPILELNGANLYARDCASCHGSLAQTAKPNRTFDEIKNAMANIPNMKLQFLSGNLYKLSDGQIRALASSLVVAPPVLSFESPSTAEGFFDEGALFYVSATGTNLRYQWQKDGVDLAGATTNQYQVPLGAFGNYSVKISNLVGNLTRNFVFTKKPVPTVQLADQFATRTETGMYSAVYGLFSGERVTVKWLVDGVLQPLCELASPAGGFVADIQRGCTIFNLVGRHTVTFIAENPSGAVSATATLTVSVPSLTVSDFILRPGQSYESNILRLVMQTDGNLVLYAMNAGVQGAALWSSRTSVAGAAAAGIVVQNRVEFSSINGNFILYGPNNNILFQTAPSVRVPLIIGGSRVRLTDQGTMVLINGNQVYYTFR